VCRALNTVAEDSVHHAVVDPAVIDWSPNVWDRVSKGLQCYKLESLCLENITEVPACAAQQLQAEGLPGCPSLQRFGVRAPSLAPESSMRVCAALSAAPQLSHLDLDCQLTGAGALLSAALRQMVGLKHLRISDCEGVEWSLGDQGALYDALTALHCLEDVSLGFSTHRDGGNNIPGLTAA
jgi:hypothetical protein